MRRLHQLCVLWVSPSVFVALTANGASSQKGVKVDNLILCDSAEILGQKNSVDHHVVYRSVVVLTSM